MSLAHRASFLLAGVALAATGVPAGAQVSDQIVLNIMRECAKIDDPTARLACYDNNIRAAGGNPNSIPGQMSAPSGGGAALQPRGAGGFGSDDLRTPAQRQANAARSGASEVSVRVSQVREREPGVYLISLDSGAQWLFTESVSSTYRLPRKSDVIEIQRGALGSYLMVFGSQQGVKVTRIK